MGIDLILTPFSQTDEGGRLLDLADRLAEKIGVGSFALADVPLGERTQEVVKRIQALRGLRVVYGRASAVPAKSGTLFISSDPVDRDDLLILTPAGETEIILSSDRCMMIPFGSRESGQFAARHALPIARQMRLPVLFYHTTWRNPSVAERQPNAHMDPGARAVLTEITEQASRHRVNSRVVVEFADDVVYGIILAAIRERASVIATARGLEVERGSYAERLVRMSPVPVLTVGRNIKEETR